MKTLLLTINSVLFCCLLVKAQSPDSIYKTGGRRDSAGAGKLYNRSGNHPDGADTARVIGFATATLYKKQPESPLGNFMADCMKLYAEKIFERRADAAFVNFSSVRYYIPKGDITAGTLFRLMPYDNKIVLLTIKGSTFKILLDHIAGLGGWPCAGITMGIRNNAAAEVMIDKKPLDETAEYTIAVADYIANGGNQCTMLKGLPQLKKNYLFRDALIDYVTTFTQQGKPVTATVEGRVVRDSE